MSDQLYKIKALVWEHYIDPKYDEDFWKATPIPGLIKYWVLPLEGGMHRIILPGTNGNQEIESFEAAKQLCQEHWEKELSKYLVESQGKESE